MKKYILIWFLLFVSNSFAQKAVLIEDNELPNEVHVPSFTENNWLSRKNEKPVSTVAQEFSGTLELRSKKRVGLGLGISGQLGMIGAFAELNFGQEDSTIVGFGTGGSYNSLGFQWKHIFNSEKLAPYLTLGYSRWFSGGQNGPITNSTPTFLSEKLLTSYEKETGKFGKDLFIPSAGLQYFLLSGPYVGSSIYIEAMLFISPTVVDTSPIGSLGMIFYF